MGAVKIRVQTAETSQYSKSNPYISNLSINILSSEKLPLLAKILDSVGNHSLPLVTNWCNAKFLQICSDDKIKLIYILNALCVNTFDLGVNTIPRRSLNMNL